MRRGVGVIRQFLKRRQRACPNTSGNEIRWRFSRNRIESLGLGRLHELRGFVLQAVPNQPVEGGFLNGLTAIGEREVDNLRDEAVAKQLGHESCSRTVAPRTQDLAPLRAKACEM